MKKNLPRKPSKKISLETISYSFPNREHCQDHREPFTRQSTPCVVMRRPDWAAAAFTLSRCFLLQHLHYLTVLCLVSVAGFMGKPLTNFYSLPLLPGSSFCSRLLFLGIFLLIFENFQRVELTQGFQVGPS